MWPNLNCIACCPLYAHLKRTVISLGILSFLSITSVHGQSSESESRERSSTIRVLWVNSGLEKSDPKSSGAMNVEVRVRRNTMVDDDKQLVPQVACSTPTPNMRSEQWLSSAWIAAFVASREKGISIAENEFNLRVPEPVDGPSASMAIAATMLALMNGDEVKDDWAITGTIGPDGSIGPVGGVDQKMLAAGRDKAKNIHRFGFPAGQRMVYNQTEGDFVDLVAFGRKVGLDEVVEINGIEDAYEFVTGKPLKTKLSEIPVGPEHLTPLQLTNSTVSRLSASIRDFSQSFVSSFEEKKQIISSRVPASSQWRPFADTMVREAENYHERMKLAQRGGALAQAYFNGLRAQACVGAGDLYSELVAPSLKSGKVTVNDVLKGIFSAFLKVRAEVESARRSLNDTIGEASTGGTFFTRVEALNASISMREGSAYQSSADEMFISALVQMIKAVDESNQSKSATVKLNENFYDALQKTAEYFAMALARYRSSKDWYSFSLLTQPHGDVDITLGDEFYKTVGKYYHKGAEAALAYVDATLVSGWENMFKKKQADARNAYVVDFGRYPQQRSFFEPAYLPMTYATLSANRRDSTEDAGLRIWMKKEGFGETIVARRDDAVQDYGSGVTALIGLSNLILKHYNYNNDTNFMQSSRSFGIFLDQARDRALHRAAQLRSQLASRIHGGENGKDVLLPAAISLNIELADTLRYGDAQDMISSFQVYWRVTMLCDLGLMMLDPAGK